MGRWPLGISIALAVFAASPARADVISDWVELGAAQTPPPTPLKPDQAERPWSLTSESDAIVAVAIFQAVNTIERRYTPYRETLAPVDGPASARAAAVAAAHAVLLKLFPAASENLEDAYQLSLASIPAGPERQRGIEVGERAAAQVIAWRTADRPADETPLRPLAPPGGWVPTTITTIPPYWFRLKPWLMKSSSQFRPDPPPDLKSAEWASDFNEVKALGGQVSATRTAEQAREARFWYRHHWNPTVRQIAQRPGRTLAQNSRLYALVAMVSEDLGIAITDGKFTYQRWRPITAIRNGDQDGNDGTERQADWLPLIPTPMHPEYPCGHCVDSNGIATVLEAEGPPPPEGVRVTSEAFPNAVFYVPTYRDLAEQISVSRIYAGAHFRSSVETGSAVGRKIGEYALKNFLLPAK